MSGQELGSLLSPPIQRQSVHQWEIGKTFPDLKRVEQLSSILKKTPEWLLFGAPRTSELSSDEIELLQNFRAMPDYSRTSILIASRVLATAPGETR